MLPGPAVPWLLLSFFPFPVGHPVATHSTVRVDSLPHRKWREIQQQPGTAGSGNMLGCCLIFLHFLWGKLSTRTVYVTHLRCTLFLDHSLHHDIPILHLPILQKSSYSLPHLGTCCHQNCMHRIPCKVREYNTHALKYKLNHSVFL